MTPEQKRLRGALESALRQLQREEEILRNLANAAFDREERALSNSLFNAAGHINQAVIIILEAKETT